MPGIHLRTLSQLDFLNQKEKSVLTIPGSYWLCHKKNIYKFIFRYDRTTKNTIQFSYGRELLKIIRRIIKCHPTQGQQFGTQHLLVTYNCTSWTRQDKMFAILKFQQRTNAATFSHAFVLTIKICSPSEQSLFNLNCPIIKETDTGTTFKDLNNSLNNEEKTTRTVIQTTDKTISNESTLCQDKRTNQISEHDVIEDKLNEMSETIVNSQDNVIENSANIHRDLNKKIKSTVTCTATEKDLIDKNNTEFRDSVYANKSPNYNIRKFEKDDIQNFIDHEQPLKKAKEKDIRIKEATNQETKYVKIQEHQKVRSIQKYNAFSSSKPFSQENANEKQRNNPIFTNADNNLQVQSNTCTKSYKTRKQRNRESERKTIADDKILRSSNITDLVMEGLMFTIRQDQDSVAVIEQKTKLEVDEVLENSEKVETKAGEKCLLNSSLLRLENLVTMIDSPRNKDEQRKSARTNNNSAYSLPFNVFTNSTMYDNLGDINYVDKMDKSNISSYDKREMSDLLNSVGSQWQDQGAHSDVMNSCIASENIMEWESNDYERKKKDTHESDIEMKKKEEDIVPETYQSTKFSCYEETKAGLQDKNVLMDDMDVEEMAKCDTSVKRHDSSLLPRSLSLSESSTKEMTVIPGESSELTKQQPTNVPRVISNKAITIEQIPLTLQKVLRYTCKKRKFSSVSSAHEQQVAQCTTENATNVSVMKEKSTDSNVEDKSSSVVTVVDAEKTKSNEDELCVTIDKDSLKANGDVYTRSTKEKSNETPCSSRASSSLKHSSPRKLQDITQDFYYDLHAYNKNNGQRRLRQRRSLNNPDNIKNGRMRIEMLKFIQDITEGAKVVVTRLNIDKSRLLEKNSTLATCTH